MSTDSELIQKRQEVREEILALKDQIPSARILNRLGGAFKQNSLGYWLSNIVLLNLIVLSPWGIIGFLLKEISRMPPTVVVQSLVVVVAMSSGFVVLNLVIQTILSDIAHHIIEKINDTDDLSKILLWFKQSWSMQKILPIVVAIGLFWVFVGVTGVSSISRQFVGFGFSFTAFIVGLLLGVVTYVYIWMSLLISNLKVYQYEINVFSPADSEIISNILAVAMKGVYILAGYSAVATSMTLKLFDQLLRNTLGIPVLILVWTLILVQFLLTRSTLGTITDRAKWKTLNRIRDKINVIEATGDLSDKDTAERILRLADIHKQVMASNTKTFDWKSVTTLFSQLMLPLLGLLLGNLDRLLELLTK